MQALLLPRPHAAEHDGEDDEEDDGRQYHHAHDECRLLVDWDGRGSAGGCGEDFCRRAGWGWCESGEACKTLAEPVSPYKKP